MHFINNVNITMYYILYNLNLVLVVICSLLESYQNTITNTFILKGKVQYSAVLPIKIMIPRQCVIAMIVHLKKRCL